MALIKHANTGDLARSAVVLDLGDLQRQADALLTHARVRAQQVLDEARAERARLVDGAAEAGRAQGLAQGLAEGRERGFEQGRAEALAAQREAIERLATTWEGALGAFEAQREAMLSQARRDVVRLAVLIAEKVTRRAVQLDEQAALAQIEAVLAMVLRPSRLRLAVCPDDRALVEAALPRVVQRFHNAQHVELVEDAGLERGSCVLRTTDTGAEIDASISTQIERIVTALLPPPAEKSGPSTDHVPPDSMKP